MAWPKRALIGAFGIAGLAFVLGILPGCGGAARENPATEPTPVPAGPAGAEKSTDTVPPKPSTSAEPLAIRLEVSKSSPEPPANFDSCVQEGFKDAGLGKLSTGVVDPNAIGATENLGTWIELLNRTSRAGNPRIIEFCTEDGPKIVEACADEYEREGVDPLAVTRDMAGICREETLGITPIPRDPPAGEDERMRAFARCVSTSDLGSNVRGMVETLSGIWGILTAPDGDIAAKKAERLLTESFGQDLCRERASQIRICGKRNGLPEDEITEEVEAQLARCVSP